MASSGDDAGDADGDRDRGREAGERGPHGKAQALGHRQRLVAVGAGQEHGELLAAEPRGDVGAARGLAQHVGEAPQHLVARLVAERVVDALEVVEVAHQQGAAVRAAQALEDARLELAPIAQPGERVVLGQVAHVVELACGLERGAGLVGEGAQGLEALGGRQQVVGRVVGPDGADDVAVGVVERDHQPVRGPGQRPAPVGRRGVDPVQRRRDERERLGLPSRMQPSRCSAGSSSGASSSSVAVGSAASASGGQPQVASGTSSPPSNWAGRA